MIRLIIILSIVFALTANAQVGVTKFPLGDHDHNFLHSDGSKEISHGFDPAFDKSQQTDKDKIINALAANGISTFDVGLPDAIEPSVLSPWPITGTITIQKLLAFNPNWPTITLPGVTGPVYLISGYENCPGDGIDGCDVIDVGAGKFAFAKWAGGMIRQTDDATSPDVWITDSLIHAVNGQPGALVFEDNSIHVMYSELLGGDDGCKLGQNHDIWRSHIHNPMRDGTEHADGCQASNAINNYFMENTLDHLYQNSNAALWIPSEGGNAGPFFAISNLLFGGQSGIRTCEKTSVPGDWVGPFVAIGNVFGAIANLSSHRDFFFSDCGGTPPIVKRGIGNRKIDGTTQDIEIFDPPTPADIAAVSAKKAQLKAWATAIRTAANIPDIDPDDDVTPPIPPPPTKPIIGLQCQ